MGGVFCPGGLAICFVWDNKGGESLSQTDKKEGDW